MGHTHSRARMHTRRWSQSLSPGGRSSGCQPAFGVGRGKAGVAIHWGEESCRWNRSMCRCQEIRREPSHREAPRSCGAPGRCPGGQSRRGGRPQRSPGRWMEEAGPGPSTHRGGGQMAKEAAKGPRRNSQGSRRQIEHSNCQQVKR